MKINKDFLIFKCRSPILQDHVSESLKSQTFMMRQERMDLILKRDGRVLVRLDAISN